MVTTQARLLKHHPPIYYLILYYILWSLLIFSSHSKTATYPPPSQTLLKSMSSANPTHTMHLIISTFTLYQAIPILEIESTIDTLATKLHTLRYASTLDNLQPLILISKNTTITLFQTPLPLVTSFSLCNTLNMPPLTLSNIPSDLQPSTPILLHFQVSVLPTSITCTTPTTTLLDESCLNTIVSYASQKILFTSIKELQQHLSTSFLNKIIYLQAYQNTITFTDAPFGKSACLGTYSSSTPKNIQSLHNHFFLKLNSVYTNIYDFLDQTTTHLSDTLHSITSDSYIPPIPLYNNTIMEKAISTNTLQQLPSSPNAFHEYYQFCLFFNSTLLNTTELKFLSLSNTKYISQLPMRHKKIILSSLLQFHHTLQYRIKSLISLFDSSITSITIPTTLLFNNTQNPLSFLNLIRDFYPHPSEDILAEIFIILQNTKSTLFQDLSFIFDKTYIPNLVSRSQYVYSLRQTSRQRHIKLPTHSENRNTSTLPHLHINLHPSSRTSQNKVTTFPITPSVHSGVVSTSAQPRQKRSWGTFWGGVFNLATQEDITKVYQHELAIGENELSISTALRNITYTNAHLLTSLQTVSTSINSLLANERHLFAELNDIITQEKDDIALLYTLSNTIDKTTSLVSEYQSLQSQTTLLIHSISNIQNLISSALTNTIDTTQIPSNLLRSHIKTNLQLSLSLAKSTFSFQPTGYYINIEIPQLSPPYTIYKIKTLPFKQDIYVVRYQTTQYIAVNSIHEFVSFDDIKNTCTKHLDTFLCNPYNIIISHWPLSISDHCSYRVLLSHHQHPYNLDRLAECTATVLPNYHNQDYIMDNTILSISNYAGNDTLAQICEPSALNNITQLPRGLTVFKTNPNCHYETYYLQIYNIANTKQLKFLSPQFQELNILNSLTNVDTLLNEQQPISINITNLEDQLRLFNSTITTNDMTIKQLSQHLDDLNTLRTIAEFNPLSLNLDRPFHVSNWISAIFWLLLIILLTAACCFTKHTHPKLFIKIITTPIIILRRLCTCLSSNPPTQQPDPNQLEMQPLRTPSLNLSPHTTPNPSRPRPSLTDIESHHLLRPPLTKWYIHNNHENELEIRAHLKTPNFSNITMLYNPFTHTVHDTTGALLDFINPPPQKLLNIFRQQNVHTVPSPYRSSANDSSSTDTP